MSINLNKSLFSNKGYFVTSTIISSINCIDLISELPDQINAGSRKLLEKGVINALAQSLKNNFELAFFLKDKIAIQCTYFKKTVDQNWSVRLHQDRVIPVNGKGEWSSSGVKEGLRFVKPPDSFLKKIIIVRLLLDNVSEGDLEVVSGSHKSTHKPVRSDTTSVIVPRGGALVMSPLLFHASRKLKVSRSRRVLHFVFAPQELPYDYSWY